MPIETYRDRLKAELTRRQMVNPRYSLRAFAKSVGLSAPFLSQVLTGRKNLSIEAAAGLTEKLGYSPEEASAFCQQVQVGNASTLKTRNILQSRELDVESGFSSLELESFAVMSDWYHFAILELSTCKGFRSNTSYISEKLEIAPAVAERAVDRLLKLGLLRKEKGRWFKTNKFLATPTDRPNLALQNFHAQMLEKARRALTDVPVQERDITGVTLSVSAERMPIAKKEIRRFLMRMSKILDSDVAEQVVQLNVQFFPLCHKTGPKVVREKK
jgi:uncharacterized protein (TIGR02147 family)